MKFTIQRADDEGLGGYGSGIGVEGEDDKQR